MKNLNEFLSKNGSVLSDCTHFVVGETTAEHLIDQMERWCAIDAYNSDNGPTDEHSIDDSRGKQCSAEELLIWLKKYAREDREDER